MFFRIRVAFGIALLAALMISITAFAKGGFSFISITGPGLKDELRVSNLELTSDFFTFADFSQNRTKAPADPGKGYEITRYYLDGKREIAFDRLQYYPETGFVYYDGIVNGESEYDGEWYTANPEIKVVFESVLAIQTGSGLVVEKKEPIPFASQPDSAKDPSQSAPTGLPSFSIIVAVIATGLIALFAFALWRRKPFTQ